MTNNQGATYAIPDPPDPPLTVCVQLQIPAQAIYFQLLWAQLNQLSYWFAWDRDPAHTGAVVAKTWADIRDSLHVCVPSDQALQDMEFEMSICEQLRFQNGVLQGLCCGVWEDISGQLPGGIGGSDQPGSGTPIPQAGQCTTYKAKVTVTNPWLLPTLVSAGDVIQCSLFGGATTNSAPLGRWNCEDGQVFQLGQCQGFKGFSSGNPAPSLATGCVMIQIGSSYFDANSPVTVPSGVNAQQAALVLNYPTGGSPAGDITCDLQICNNGAVTWTSTLDFTISPYSSVVTPHFGAYVAGVGYEGTFEDSASLSIVQLVIAVSGAHISSMSMIYSTPGQAGANGVVGFETDTGVYGSFHTPGAQTDATLTETVDRTGVNLLWCDNNVGTLSGTPLISKWVINGIGAKPSILP